MQHTDIAQTLWLVAVIAIPVIIAITLHEAAHGFVARHFGDPTAANLGRVTLNPLKHVDPVGTILLPAVLLLTHAGILFGYAKPVPVNFAALRHPKRDMIWVAAAGPGMNVLLAVISAGLLSAALHLGADPNGFAPQLFFASVQINLVLAVLNMIPLPPLDGGRVAVGLLPQPLSGALDQLSRFGLLLVLALFILLPLAGVNIGQWLVARPVEWLERPLLAIFGIH
ncbi:MAG TPA: site-2 protease family protein [Rhizomicrobium sp.]|nr:site-2 protease family protein [Rhizomicrobium sp.]